MSEVDAFGKALFETILANKLSASRVDRVKTHATRCFHESSLAIKMMVKCHKKCPKSSKISSLYLFDAVVRHAADIVRKQGQSFDAHGAKAPKSCSLQEGTTEALVAGASAFLSTAPQAAEEICLDTLASVAEEQQVSTASLYSSFSPPLRYAFPPEYLLGISSPVRMAADSSCTALFWLCALGLHSIAVHMSSRNYAIESRLRPTFTPHRCVFVSSVGSLFLRLLLCSADS
jgi:hypothetical protein